MPAAENDNVVKTLLAKGSNCPLRNRIGRGHSVGRANVCDSDGRKLGPEVIAIEVVFDFAPYSPNPHELATFYAALLGVEVGWLGER